MIFFKKRLGVFVFPLQNNEKRDPVKRDLVVTVFIMTKRIL